MRIEYDISKYTLQEAYTIIDTHLDGLLKDNIDKISNPTKQWNNEKNKMDFGFDINKVNINGNIKLEEKKLIVEGKLPWIARMYNGKVKDIIIEQLEEWFP